MNYDLFIAGGGPAGMAAGIQAAGLGLRVALFARPNAPSRRRGESLAPSCRRVLRDLGVWDAFRRDGHLPCPGNLSLWGGEEPSFHSFLEDPYGHGWHIERPLLEKRLRERAEEAGVFIIETTLREIPANAFLVDATGRPSWLARRLGARRRRFDRQVALVGFLSTGKAPMSDARTLVEALPDGWWYSALQPDGRLVAAFFTDAGLRGSTRKLKRRWPDLLKSSRLTRYRVQSHGYELDGEPAVFAAGQERLEPLGGDGWLPAGDAAFAYDPLSSHGLTLALASGRDAATAAAARLDGDRQALTRYRQRLNRAFQHYATLRQKIYQAETRWPTHPYWRDRHRSKVHGQKFPSSLR